MSGVGIIRLETLGLRLSSQNCYIVREQLKDETDGYFQYFLTRFIIWIFFYSLWWLMYHFSYDNCLDVNTSFIAAGYGSIIAECQVSLSILLWINFSRFIQ
jgi:hypothetical protein